WPLVGDLLDRDKPGNISNTKGAVFSLIWDFCPQLTTLAMNNIPHLAINTNHSLDKAAAGGKRQVFNNHLIAPRDYPPR
ncbi:hypothetical protein BG004_003514, partial [Podila humilis]